jgi:hypothetical protein
MVARAVIERSYRRMNACSAERSVGRNGRRLARPPRTSAARRDDLLQQLNVNRALPPALLTHAEIELNYRACTHKSTTVRQSLIDVRLAPTSVAKADIS